VQGLLEILERHDGAVFEDGAWRLLADAPLPEPSEIWRALLADQPELVGDLALLSNAAETLAHALRDGATSVDLQTSAMLDHFLYASPAGARALDGLGAAVRDLGGRVA